MLGDGEPQSLGLESFTFKTSHHSRWRPSKDCTPSLYTERLSGLASWALMKPASVCLSPVLKHHFQIVLTSGRFGTNDVQQMSALGPGPLKGHVNFMAWSCLPYPEVSWGIKGNHQANPNQISQASICPA